MRIYVNLGQFAKSAYLQGLLIGLLMSIYDGFGGVVIHEVSMGKGQKAPIFKGFWAS